MRECLKQEMRYYNGGPLLIINIITYSKRFYCRHCKQYRDCISPKLWG